MIPNASIATPWKQATERTIVAKGALKEICHGSRDVLVLITESVRVIEHLACQRDNRQRVARIGSRFVRAQLVQVFKVKGGRHGY